MAEVAHPFTDHSLVIAKGLAQLNDTMSCARQGHAKWMGQREEFWQNMVHWGGEGNGNPLQHSCLENPMDGIKRQKDVMLAEPPMLEGVQYAPGEEQMASTKSSSKNEVAVSF